MTDKAKNPKAKIFLKALKAASRKNGSSACSIARELNFARPTVYKIFEGETTGWVNHPAVLRALEMLPTAERDKLKPLLEEALWYHFEPFYK